MNTLNIHLCKGDETLQDAVKYVSEHDPDGRTFEADETRDLCYVGDERFANAPALVNLGNRYFALRIAGSEK